MVEVVRNYKYLGVRLTENGKLDTRREELLGKLTEYWSFTHGEGYKNLRMLKWLKENLT